MLITKPVKQDINADHGSDDFQTPAYALPMVAQYISKDATVWEPAEGRGNIVRFFMERGNVAIGSDIKDGRNFFDFCPEGGYDVLVTNPPFSVKKKWVERCLSLGKPFALLMPVSFMEAWGTRTVDREGMGIIMPYQRIAFETPTGKKSSPHKKTCWFTWRLNVGEKIKYVDLSGVIPKHGLTAEV